LTHPRTRSRWTPALAAIILIGIAVASVGVAGIAAWAGVGPLAGDREAEGLGDRLRLSAASEQGRVLNGAPFRDAAGQPVSLVDFRGRIVVLNLWATWCGPCIREMPTLDRLQHELGDEGLTVVAVSTDRASTADLRRFFDRQGYRYLDLYHDRGGDLYRALNPSGLPVTYILDRHGRVLARHMGYMQWDHPKVVAMLRDLL